jgi:predicted nucleic acid-binding protein
MRTAVDTNVFSRIVLGGPSAELAKTLLWDCAQRGSIVICPVVYAEMLANSMLDTDQVDELLSSIHAVVDTGFDLEIWKVAGLRFREYGRQRRISGGGEARRLLADFVVGSHALSRAEQLLTFDGGTYASYFPELPVIGASTS